MDKKSYAFGMSVASSFYQQGIHVANVEDFLKGLKDMLTGTKPEISMEEAGEALEAFYKELEDEASERAAAAGAAAKEEGEKFLAQMAKDPQVKATGSGLMYKVIKEGILPLRGHLPQRSGVRQLLQERRTHRVRPEPGHQGLDRRSAADERRRQVRTVPALSPRLR